MPASIDRSVAAENSPLPDRRVRSCHDSVGPIGMESLYIDTAEDVDDDDVPDNQSLTLLTESDGFALDSPSKGSTKLQRVAREDPDVAKSDPGSRKNSRPDIGPESLPVLSPQPTPVKPAKPPVESPVVDSFPAISSIHSTSAKQPFRSTIISPAEPKHRSKSMIVGNQPPVSPSNAAAPQLGTLDRKMSPSEKFRSFMKNFTPVKNEVMEGVAESADGETNEEGLSIKGGVPFAKGASSRKMLLTPEEEERQKAALKERIARVQEEQAKFRRSQKMRASFLTSPGESAKGSSKDLLGKDKPKEVKKPKINKNGTAQSYNSYSILAGLRKKEFRQTLELGADLLQHTRRLSEDLFNMDSLPLSHGDGHMHNHNEIHRALAHVHRLPSERSVTLSGEGYMSEEDWRITNREIKEKKQAAVLTGKKTLQSGPSSQQNLEEFIQQSLKEEAAHSIPVDDCPDQPDVPLAYLQSSNLIERRFGWEQKDHSVAKTEVVRHKSWMTLRNAVQGAGAFNMIAAAAAAPPMGSESTSSTSFEEVLTTVPTVNALEPAANAPVIVLEATPVTEFVAKIVREQQQRSHILGDSDDHSLGSHRSKGPTFTISKEIPQKLSPEKLQQATSSSPPPHSAPLPHTASSAFLKPAKPVIAKEDAKAAKMRANTKEFHDRYNGLIFHDSSRNLTWQDTADLILGTGHPHHNNILNTRSDMRWAGKTLNMFRPWSAARQEDVIDQFLHRQASSRPGSSPESGLMSGRNSGKTSPTEPLSPLRVGTLPRIDSISGDGSSVGDKNERSIVLDGGGSTAGSVTFGSVTYNSGKNHPGWHIGDLGSDAGSALTMNSQHQGSRSTVGRRAPLLINLVKNLPVAGSD